MSSFNLTPPKFNYQNAPSSQAQNAAGLVNIANSFATNRKNGVDWGSMAANGARNRIEKDTAFLQEAGATLAEKHTTDTMEEIHKLKLKTMKDQARQQASKSIAGSIGSIVGMGAGFALGGPMGAGIGSKLGSVAGGMFG